MKTIVVKFGGSSLASAAQFRKVGDILRADPARRFLVVSAPGKRDSGDTKVTDLLIALADKATKGEDAEPALAETRACFPVAGDNTVDKVEWDNGRVYINATQYFDNVPTEAWEQQIGGYRPAEKWLKDRKGRVLTPPDVNHYRRIILALAKTRAIMDSLQ